jgi:hypothetical protein
MNMFNALRATFRITFVTAATALVFAGVQPALAQDILTLCTPDLPDCVQPNWGMTEPDSTDALTTGNGRLAAASGRIAVKPMPVALKAAATPSVKAVTAPTNYLPKETAALVAAIKRARFAKDGTIVTGQQQIAAAANAIASKAGKVYVLTLYVKTAAHVKPDTANALAKRVEAVNGALLIPGETGKPRS